MRARGRGPSLAARLALVALGLLGGLGAAEVAIRAAGLAPEVVWLHRGRFQLAANPKLGYEPIPDLTADGPIGSFHDYSGASNRLGFRDRDHPRQKPPGVFRVLVLGDSIAAGQGVERFEDTFPPRVELGLAARGLAAEVLNFGVSGYNTRQEVEMLEEKGLAYQPDLVLVAYCLNDGGRADGGILNALLADARGERHLLASRTEPWLAWSALYRFLRFRFGDASAPASAAEGDTRTEAFDLLGALARRHRFAVVVTIFPRFGKLLDYRWGEQNREVAELARAKGLQVLDLLAAYQGCFRVTDEPLALNRFHPTARGHQCAADAITDFIVGHRGELGAGAAPEG